MNKQNKKQAWNRSTTWTDSQDSSEGSLRLGLLTDTWLKPNTECWELQRTGGVELTFRNTVISTPGSLQTERTAEQRLPANLSLLFLLTFPNTPSSSRLPSTTLTLTTGNT